MVWSRNTICVCKTWQKIVYEWEIILMNVGHDRHVCLAKKIRKCQQFSCGGIIYSCHIRVQQDNDGTGLTNNVHFSRLWRPPVTCKISHSQLLQCFLGIVLFPTGCMSNVPTRSKEWETWTLNMNMFRSVLTREENNEFSPSIKSLIILVSLLPDDDDRLRKCILQV